MAKKDYVKITQEGLNLLTVLNTQQMREMESFYNKDVFLSDGFSGEITYLFQAIGMLGGRPQNRELEKETSIIVVSNNVFSSVESPNQHPFIQELEDKLNQNNSPFRKVFIITEKHLIEYFENRIKLINDEVLKYTMEKYKESKKLENIQKSLF